MATIAHLSDIHFGAGASPTDPMFASLVAALAAKRAQRGARIDLLIITGDVFDSSKVDDAVVARFLDLYRAIDAALGGDVPAVFLPGNHDRRATGVIGPHDEKLFTRLRSALAPRTNVVVCGCATPFLAALVPASIHGLAAHVVAYDTTYLPHGWFSAGGVIRQEDLLQVADRIAAEGAPEDRPLIVLMHHHLIPTPLTDVEPIDTGAQNALSKWVITSALPALVANADRAELTMTALGAGTALSTLHAFGRAVIVLHGHKHYPTVRLLTRTAKDQGDVLLVSAGSAGKAEPWRPSDHPDVPRLWPSFNLVDFDDRRFAVETVSYSPKRVGLLGAPRALLRAERHGAAWELAAIDDAPRAEGAAMLARNEAVITLRANGARAWDLACVRRIEGESGVVDGEYAELIEGASGARLTRYAVGGASQPDSAVPARIVVPMNGETRYELLGGICRTLDAAAAEYGVGEAFEWIGLFNRYASRVARLVFEHRGLDARPFASATDLVTGRERPVSLARTGERAELLYEDCPPRTLLRIYWPLA
jgi:3',5'-cyclic AMP phosphodiesterase CpdA